jgi:hypothetical protein
MEKSSTETLGINICALGARWARFVHIDFPWWSLRHLSGEELVCCMEKADRLECLRWIERDENRDIQSSSIFACALRRDRDFHH